MKIRPEYSVVMSVYSGDDPSQLRASINSILNQTYKPNQFVIVVDGPILDGVCAALSEYKKIDCIEFHYLKSNVGLAMARNFAIEKCKNDFIGVMDADDISLEDRFQIQVDEMLKSDVDVIGGWISEFDTESDVLKNNRIRSVPEFYCEIFKRGKTRNPMNHVTFFFKKKVITDIGGYRKIPFYEDYDLIVRLMMQGAILFNLQKVLVLVRCGDGMFSRRGGIKNIATEFRFFYGIYKMGYLNLFNFILNMVLRIPVRLVPSRMRKFIYVQFLRIQ